MLHPLILVLSVSVIGSLWGAFPSLSSMPAERDPSPAQTSVISALEAFQKERESPVLKNHKKDPKKDARHTPLPGLPSTECGCSARETHTSLIQKVQSIQASTKDQETIHAQPIQTLVFISSSMPMHDLKRLAEEAVPHHAALVMRGLIEGSFQKTLPFVQSLKGSVMLDPRLFQAFHVQTVPTFIRLHQPLTIGGGRASFEAPPHDVVRGNMSLQGALHVMEGGVS